MHVETYRVLKKLESYPTFGVDTIANIIRADAGYARVYLHRLEKRGLVQKIQRNVYTVQKDPLVVASRIVWPSYISLWSALRYHNLTEQLPNEVSILTTALQNGKKMSAMGTDIVFYHIKPQYFFGFSKVLIDGMEVFMAEPEKAILDTALLRKASFSEIYSMLKENQDRISLDKLTDYIIIADNAAAAKRFGWALDRLGYPDVQKLKPMAYGTRILLDYSRPKSKVIDNKWGLIENIMVTG
jgi:predicted transcriptional regulator of viral defense system